MAYEPHEWQVGDKITSARLNNMEQGIAASGSVVTLPIYETDGKKTLHASYDDVVGALAAGKMIFVIDSISHPGYVQIMPVLGHGYSASTEQCAIDAFDAAQQQFLRQFRANSRTAQLTEITDSDLPK